MRRIADNLKAWIQRSNETLIELIIGILAVNICTTISGAVISGNVLTFCLGELLGTVYAVFAVIHMAQTIEDSLDMPEDSSSKYAKRGYALRLVIAVVVMIIALKVPVFHFVGVFLAMMGLKIAAWINPLIHKLMTR